MGFLKPLGLSKTECFDIRLSLEEALINAIKYGNGLQKNLKVLLTVSFNSRNVELVLEDQGEGFNPQALIDCTKKSSLLRSCGRGVYLIHRLMDKVKYNSKGNRIQMFKRIHPKKRSQSL